MKPDKGLKGQISGHTRKRTYLLHGFEDVLIKYLSKRMPPFIETYHLTLSSIFTAALAIVSGHFSHVNRYWLLGIPLALIIHWLTDMMDGEIGRIRGTGLVKWGFYADHFLDFIFMSSIFIGYSLAFPNLVLLNTLMIIGMGLLFIDSALYALVGKEYSTSGIVGRFGPSEGTFAIASIGIGFLFISDYWITLTYIFMATVLLTGVFIQFIFHQKELWDTDLGNK